MKKNNKNPNPITSIHPLAILGEMFVFILPSIFLTHSTSNLATHGHIKRLTFAFSVSFAIVFGLLLLMKLYAEMNRMQQLSKCKKENDSVNFSLPAIFSGMLIAIAGISVTFSGSFSSSNIIHILDSNIPSQAREISRQTAAVNYYLIFGALLLLLGYFIIHSSLNNTSADANSDKQLSTTDAMAETSNFWFLPLSGFGVAGAFALKGATQVPHGLITLYTAVIFAAGLTIAMPKVIRAWIRNHAICESEKEGYEIPGKLYSTIFLLALTFTCFGAGITSSALYGDPLWGSIFMVVALAPMMLMAITSDSVVKHMPSMEKLKNKEEIQKDNNKELELSENDLTNM